MQNAPSATTQSDSAVFLSFVDSLLMSSTERGLDHLFAHRGRGASTVAGSGSVAVANNSISSMISAPAAPATAGGGALHDTTNVPRTANGSHCPTVAAQIEHPHALAPAAAPSSPVPEEFFPCLPEAKRRQMGEWFKRQSAWCELMPPATDVTKAVTALTDPRRPTSYSRLLDDFMAAVRGTHPPVLLKGTTLASGVSYFVRFLGTASAVINSGNPEVVEEQRRRQQRRAQQQQGDQQSDNNSSGALRAAGGEEANTLKTMSPRVAQPGSVLPPLPENMPLELPMCLDQCVHLAKSLLDSAHSVEESCAHPNREQKKGAKHRDYLLATLRYDLLSVTPYHFLNYLGDTSFATNRYYEGVMNRAVATLEILMWSPLWLDHLPSSLAAIALYVSFYHSVGVEIDAQYLPQAAHGLLHDVLTEIHHHQERLEQAHQQQQHQLQQLQQQQQQQYSGGEHHQQQHPHPNQHYPPSLAAQQQHQQQQQQHQQQVVVDQQGVAHHHQQQHYHHQ